MNLTPLAVALQGVGYGPQPLALQGFYETAGAVPQPFYRNRVKVIRKKRENDEALLLLIL